MQLPRGEVDFLLAHAREVIDVQGAIAPGRYRLTPRGFVGFLDGPTCRFKIRPKLPWPNLLMLLGLDHKPAPGGETVEPPADVLAVLADELATRIEAVGRAGFLGGYREADTESAYLRGRLRVREQIKDAAARAFPDHFHITETVFDLDAPWNRILKSVASDLILRQDLPLGTRDRLAAALQPLATIPAGPLTESDFDAAAREPRVTAYNGAITLCRLVRHGLQAADPVAARPGGFLIDLGRAFERYLIAGVGGAVAARPGWSADAQVGFTLAAVSGEPVTLRPDLLIRRQGTVKWVLDAKWKRPAPDPADLHQILAYAAVTGAPRVGLVYPGRRTTCRELVADGGRVRVSLFRLRVVGSSAGCQTSAARLAQVVRRASGR
jgi:5-methylcytosine-specific restriction enzyme subunit McrC